MPRFGDDPYEAVPHNGKVFVGDYGEQYYWNFADSGTIIERDFPRLHEESGGALVRMREIEYHGQKYVIQLWRVRGHGERVVGLRGGPMMTDGEYREYLVALARKFLRVAALARFGPLPVDHLNYEIDRLSSIARLIKVAAGRPEKPNLLAILAEELRNVYVDPILRTLDQAGILAALDEAPDITFGNLRRSAIPQEDVDLLRRAGVEDPEAEITLIIHYCRKRLGGPDAELPSTVAQSVPDLIKEAAERIASKALESHSQSDTKKRRKIFNGAGKILVGAITAGGNLLLASGTIVAPNPATAYGVIGCSALAVGSISQGIGDLRGE